MSTGNVFTGYINGQHLMATINGPDPSDARHQLTGQLVDNEGRYIPLHERLRQQAQQDASLRDFEPIIKVD